MDGLMNAWMNEWMNEWIDEWNEMKWNWNEMNEWMNKWYLIVVGIRDIYYKGNNKTKEKIYNNTLIIY